MYEHRREPLLPVPEFRRRVLSHLVLAFGAIAFGIVLGMAGFRITEHYSWTDAFLNTCMLLGGMGQVNPIATTGGKLFAGLFALFAGLIFIAVAGLLVIPFAHRVLHKLHLDR
jgi:flagellar biosynthesis protein FliR